MMQEPPSTPLTPDQTIMAALLYVQHQDVQTTVQFLRQQDRYAPEVQAIRTMTLSTVQDACRDALTSTLCGEFSVPDNLARRWVTWLEGTPAAASPAQNSEPTLPAIPATAPAIPATEPAQPAAATPAQIKPPSQPKPVQSKPSQPKPVQAATKIAGTQLNIERITALLGRISGRTDATGLHILALAFQASGHEHLIGHVKNKRRPEDITNATGVHGGMTALNGYNRRAALSDAKTALQTHINLGFTLHQIATLTRDIEIDEAGLRDLNLDGRNLTTGQLLAAQVNLKQPPGEARASMTMMQDLRQKIGYITEAGHTLKKIQKTVAQHNQQKKRSLNPEAESLLTDLIERPAHLTQFPPGRTAATQAQAFLELYYAAELNISERVRVLASKCSELLSQQHVTRKALLGHINLLHPEITNAALHALYGGKVNPELISRLAAIEEFMASLTDTDYQEMRAQSYEMMSGQSEQNVITSAVAQRIRTLLRHLPGHLDASAARMSGLSSGRVSALRSEPGSAEEQYPVTLGQMLTLERQLKLLSEEVNTRATRRSQLSVINATTPQAREAAVLLNFKRVGELSVLDVVDILNINEEEALALLRGMRQVTEQPGGTYCLSTHRAV